MGGKERKMIEMSYGSEVAEELMIDAEIAYSQHINRLMKDMWTMRDGKTISVSDMTNKHIRNCLNMLENKNDEISKMWFNRFEQELKDRYGK
jgi:nuclear transport factor 2 (NTF2) superfamily protein